MNNCSSKRVADEVKQCFLFPCDASTIRVDQIWVSNGLINQVATMSFNTEKTGTVSLFFVIIFKKDGTLEFFNLTLVDTRTIIMADIDSILTVTICFPDAGQVALNFCIRLHHDCC
ncbi:S-Ena type endospore appendage [Vallitalea okinawensis]|uniref:S-Ena type endospore appendage n=1 Tax=Vallitalea okinawensis TaxID=2078660 RepID=UPI000CFCB585|nr:S-Ena type endospore appendage [Vallitalea okinawensis]